MEASQKTQHNLGNNLRVFAADEPMTPEVHDQAFFLKCCLEEKDREILHLQNDLANIQCTLGWKILKRIPNIPLLQKLASFCAAPIISSLRLLRKRFPKPGDVELQAGYRTWIEKNEPSPIQLQSQRNHSFAIQPKISIITPTWNTPSHCLREMLDSVIAQTYPNWELCIADGNSSSSEVRKILDHYSGKDPRIRVQFLPQNQGIAGNTNAALAMATGDFIGLLDHDDTLAPFALFEVVDQINQSSDTADLLYSDEDLITADSKTRFSPVFKPAFGWDTIRSHNFICHFLVIRSSIMNKLNGFRKGFDGSQDYDLVLRACEAGRAIIHIPKVLYHWRVHPASTAGNPTAKSYAHEAGRKALQSHLDRVFGNGQACHGKATGLYQAVFHHTHWPLISIIIPNKDEPETLNHCIQSLFKDQYPNLEILILENGSVKNETFALYNQLQQDPRVRIEKWEQPFSYAAINNLGASMARGELLLFLNNDVESLVPNNLRRMAEHSLREEVGIVGSALYYPDHTCQHAGVTLAMTGIAGHTMRNTPKGKLGYGFRMATIRNQSCVTGACLMIRKNLFSSLGGFDEHLAIAFNDIDLCMKARKDGKAVVWTPHAEFLHHESKTRGPEDTPEKKTRFQREITYFQNKWNAELSAGDPFYSPNLSPHSETPAIRTEG